MTIPLIFLALVTCGAGFIPFGHFISSNGESYTIHLDWTVAGTSIVIALLSIALATYMYKGSKQPVADSLQRRFSGLWTAAYHRFYIDEVYQFITHKIIFRCISKPIAWFDRHVIDARLFSSKLLNNCIKRSRSPNTVILSGRENCSFRPRLANRSRNAPPATSSSGIKSTGAF